jgi:hypothetical protein
MKGRRLLVAAGAAVAVGGILAGCGSNIQPSLGQYAITTGHGTFSNQQVIAVTQPGQQVHTNNGTTTWYVPADIRNYVTAPTNGDRDQSTQEITGPGAKGEPGMPDYVQSYLAFELNPAIGADKAVASNFLAYCLKYACATQTAQNDTSNASLARSSTPGWENMLNEVLPRAIDNATRLAISSYQPDLWTTQADWTPLGNQIAAALPAQIKLLDGDNGAPYFCGPGSTDTKCAPFTFVINKIQPANNQVVNTYNGQVNATYQAQSAQALLSAAKAEFGPFAYEELTDNALIQACQAAGQNCQIILGNTSGVSVSTKG